MGTSGMGSFVIGSSIALRPTRDGVVGSRARARHAWCVPAKRGSGRTRYLLGSFRVYQTRFLHGRGEVPIEGRQPDGRPADVTDDPVGPSRAEARASVPGRMALDMGSLLFFSRVP